MATNPQKLLRDALELSEDQRAALAYDLLNSLEPAPAVEEDDQEWIAEIERRAQAALDGEPGIDWEEARSAIQQRLARG